MSNINAVIREYGDQIAEKAAIVGVDFTKIDHLNSGKNQNLPVINKAYKGKVAVWAYDKVDRSGKSYVQFVFYTAKHGGVTERWSSYEKNPNRGPRRPIPRPNLKLVSKKQQDKQNQNKKWHQHYKSLHENGVSMGQPTDYLLRKKIANVLEVKDIKVHQDFRGQFVGVPLKGLKGGYVGMERIYDDKKLATPAVVEGQYKGAHYVLGNISLEEGGIIYIVEGFASGVSAYMAKGHPVVVARSAGNLAVVTAHFAKLYSDTHTIIIAADNDDHGKGNAGISKALAAARESGAKVVAPTRAGDWNDIHVEDGLGEVEKQLENFITVPRGRKDYLLTLLEYATKSEAKKLIGQITWLSGAPFTISAELLIEGLYKEVKKRVDRQSVAAIVHGTIEGQRRHALQQSTVRPEAVDDHMTVETVLNEEGRPSIPPELPAFIKGLEGTIILVRSPMGTGKTEILLKNLTQSLAKAVNVAPRVSLVRDMAGRLGLEHYSDIEAVEAPFCEKFALCCNSFGNPLFAPVLRDIDILGIDEVTQVLPQIVNLGTPEAKKANFKAFKESLESSKYVLALDAGANDYAAEQLKLLCPEKQVICIDIVNPDPKPIDICVTQNQILATEKIVEGAKDNKNILIAMDSRKGAMKLENLIRKMKPGTSILNIYREPEAYRIPDIDAFCKNPNEECDKYQVVIYSPAITSGLSITKQHFDLHFGLFIGQISSQDQLQMMGRDRTATRWYLAIKDRMSQFDLSFSEWEKGLMSLSGGKLSDFDYLKIATDLYHDEGKKNLFTQTLHICESLGHNVHYDTEDPKDAPYIGRQLREIGEMLKAKRLTEIKDLGGKVSEEEYERINGSRIKTSEEKNKIDAYRIQHFLCAELEDASIEFYDDDGTGKIKRLEAFETLRDDGEGNLRRYDKEEEKKEASDRYYALNVAKIFQELLSILKIDPESFAGEINHQDARKALEYFMQDGVREQFNTLGLGRLNSGHPPKCATTWLKKLLAKLGLSLGKRKTRGRIIRFIERSSIEKMQGYLSARKNQGLHFFKQLTAVAA